MAMAMGNVNNITTLLISLKDESNIIAILSAFLKHVNLNDKITVIASH